MWIKICGIKTLEAALAVRKLGGDAVGFNFVKNSRRYISPRKAREIIGNLDGTIEKVGVFADAPREEVLTVAGYCRLDAVQLHGKEGPEYCRGLPYKVIKAFPVKDRSSLEMIEDYDVDMVLVDSHIKGSFGGSGIPFDWSLLCGFTAGKKLILAGGLNPQNVVYAITEVRPFGVDVASGVETGGKKDIGKIREFIEKVRRWENENIE